MKTLQLLQAAVQRGHLTGSTTATAAQAYTWDAHGNLLDDGTSTYVYDAANRLVAVEHSADVYAYNAAACPAQNGSASHS